MLSIILAGGSSGSGGIKKSAIAKSGTNCSLKVGEYFFISSQSPQDSEKTFERDVYGEEDDSYNAEILSNQSNRLWLT